MRPFLAVAQDVEGAVVVLDVSVAVPHVFVGIAVLECHGNCHTRNLQLSSQNAGSGSSLMRRLANYGMRVHTNRKAVYSTKIRDRL
jgi:hypothetical protein